MQVWCLNFKRLPREESLEITSVQLNLTKPNLSVWKSRLNVLIMILSKITLKFRNEIFGCNSEIHSSLIFITEYWIIPSYFEAFVTIQMYNLQHMGQSIAVLTQSKWPVDSQEWYNFYSEWHLVPSQKVWQATAKHQKRKFKKKVWQLETLPPFQSK